LCFSPDARACGALRGTNKIFKTALMIFNNLRWYNDSEGIVS
jgi:hypothetical protein